MYLQENLRYLIEKKRLNIAEAERKAGLKIHSIRNIINGKSLNPVLSTLSTIANSLGVTVDQITNVNMAKKCGGMSFDDRNFFIDVTKSVINELKEYEEPVELITVQKIIEDSYIYSSRKNPKKVDKDFISWIIEEKITNT